uniref:Tudor domain-containing protein n=1 Tax=Trichogramma kaykai TaxID=54128 RepID=A0ABD2X9C8_9HYME
MFALVFWTKTKNVSVVKAEQLQPDVAEGAETSVKYSDGKNYSAKVVRKSYDETYLRKINVNCDGEIIPPKKSKIKSLAAEEKVLLKEKSSETKKKQMKVAEISNQHLLQLPNVLNDLNKYGTESESSDDENLFQGAVKRKRTLCVESSDEEIEEKRKKIGEGNEDCIENLHNSLYEESDVESPKDQLSYSLNKSSVDGVQSSDSESHDESSDDERRKIEEERIQDRERAEQQLQVRERAEQQRQDRERAEQQRQNRERAEQQRQDRERAEQLREREDRERGIIIEPVALPLEVRAEFYLC